MFNTQQTSDHESPIPPATDPLFSTANAARMPGTTVGGPHLQPQHQLGPAIGPTPALCQLPLAVPEPEITSWYRAKRVWLAAALLLAAVAFRVTASPDPVTLQSADLATEVPDGE
jgi:hypothetical protein